MTSPAQAALAARGIILPTAPLAVRAVHRADLADLGRATAATPVRLAIALKYRNAAELQRLIQLQGDRRSPFYHHFLKPAQFAAEFAPLPADYRRVQLALQAAGFRVAPGLGNRTIVDAVGSAPVAERFFSTEIHRVAQAGHGLRYANVTDAVVPASISDAVRTVAGIDNVVKMHSMRVPAVNDEPFAAAPDASSDLSGPIERKVNGKFAGLYPTAIADAYNYPAQQGYTGAGHSIAIVIDSDIADSDLKAFWKATKTTRTGNFYRVYVDGATSTVNGDVGETAIDTELSSSLAPAADVYVYVIPDLSDQSIEDAYNLAVDYDIVDVVSSSFGGCELDDTSFGDATDSIAQQAAVTGMTFTASTGDAGGVCEDYNPNTGKAYYNPDVVNLPAADPTFVAVGGTTLKVNATSGARTSETAWGPGGAGGGGGGGVSSHFAVPSYQQGTSGIAVVPNVNTKPPQDPVNAGFAGRNVPDISLDASNKTGSYVAVYVQGAWTGYGGTSVSNPMFAAYVLETNQEVGNGIYAGFLNPDLYQLFNQYGYSYLFYDVTSGSIGGGWSATTGYDQATGIGSITGGTL